MAHEELLADIKQQIEVRKELGLGDIAWSWNALRAVVELHKPHHELADGGADSDGVCLQCSSRKSEQLYPCPTIQAIEKELM